MENEGFEKDENVKVLIGCVWQKAIVEGIHKDNPDYYLVGTNKWSTHFHKSNIRKV